MKTVERFFHIRPREFDKDGNEQISTKGGATVRVIGAADGVTVQYALCSANDPFDRSLGRWNAKKHVEKVMTLNSLPGELQAIARQVTSRVLKLSHTKRKQHPLWNVDYSFSTKYFNKE